MSASDFAVDLTAQLILNAFSKEQSNMTHIQLHPVETISSEDRAKLIPGCHVAVARRRLSSLHGDPLMGSKEVGIAMLERKTINDEPQFVAITWGRMLSTKYANNFSPFDVVFIGFTYEPDGTRHASYEMIL